MLNNTGFSKKQRLRRELDLTKHKLYDTIINKELFCMRKHTLSQHFLKSPKLALILIGHSNIKKRDLVLDIGAGSGVITTALSKRCKEVWAIEPDHETAEKLRNNLEKGNRIKKSDYSKNNNNQDSRTHSSNQSNVKIIEKNFLELELPKDRPYKVFANPPFHLSSEIVHKLIEAENPPEAIYLILQKQFALKLLNTDRHYTSQLGFQITKDYQTKIRYPLKNTDFTPPPAVPTVLFEAKLIKKV